jgi:hypothetical protein
MATVLGTLTVDFTDIFKVDFAVGDVRVKLSANTNSVVDPDANQIRVMDTRWQSINVDGTVAFPNLIVAADTFVPGSLQYYLHIKHRGREVEALGPYVLSSGTQDITDLVPATPRSFNAPAPVVDDTTLASADAYTDAAIDAHEAAANPHPQYARLTTTAGTPTSGRFILAVAGQPFPPVEVGSVLIYGGV